MKTKVKTNLLVIAMSLAVAFTMMPMIGQENVYAAGESVQVCGITVSTADPEDVLGDGSGTVKWDQQTKTLTLTDADLLYSTTVVDIRESGVTVKLEGDNKITCTGTNDGDYGIFYAGYGLTINGSGKLTVNTDSICITNQNASPFQGDIVIDGVTLDLRSANTDCLSGKSVTIQNGAKITAKAGGKAVFSDDGDIIIDGAIVDASSTNTSAGSTIWSNDSLRIKKGSKVSSTADNGHALQAYSLDDTAEQLIVISGEGTEVTATSKSGDFTAVFAVNEFRMTDGAKISATSTQDSAIYGINGVTIQDSEVTKADGNLWGLTTYFGPMKIENSKVTTSSKTGASMYAEGGITIAKKSNVTASTGGTGAIIAFDSELIIDDSTIEATSSGNDYALYGETLVAIRNNSNVTAYQTNAGLANYAAIGCARDIIIDSSKVKASAVGLNYGLKGRVTIKGNSDMEAEARWAFNNDGTLEPAEKTQYRIYDGDSKSTAGENLLSPFMPGRIIPAGEDLWEKRYLHIYSECVHDWSAEWSMDENGHWYECSICHEKKDETPHDWQAATCTEPKTCKICNATEGDPLGHHWQFDGFEWQQPGQIVHRDGIYAMYSCLNDPAHTSKEHNQLVITVSRIEPTCDEDGGAKFTAEIDALYSKDGQYHKGEKEVIEPGTATGHNYGEWTELDARQHQRVCRHDGSHVETEEHTWDDGKVTKPATEKEEGIKTFTCTVCRATKTESIPKLDPSKVSYSITEGNGQTWYKGSKEATEFTFKRSEDDSETFSHFTGIKVDGKAVAESHYTAESGSVIIKLKPGYLETLKSGDHKLVAEFDDGSASASFKVADSKEGSSGGEEGKKRSGRVVKTGDGNHILIWIAMILAALALKGTAAHRR